MTGHKQPVPETSFRITGRQLAHDRINLVSLDT